MKIQKISFDLGDNGEEDLHIGLIRQVKQLPVNEFFFQINRASEDFNFQRIEDLIVEGKYYKYSFFRYRTFHKTTKECITFIANKSADALLKKEQNMLFPEEEYIKYLLNEHKDVEFIMTTADAVNDFSLILLPENLVFKTQAFSVPYHEELYSIIKYYE